MVPGTFWQKGARYQNAKRCQVPKRKKVPCTNNWGEGYMITKKAYAKVNLSLDIVGFREDGYHLVRMVMQSLDIYDELEFRKIDRPEIRVFLKNEEAVQERAAMADGADASGESTLGSVPLDENNLIYKVAKLLFDKYIWKKSPDSGVEITLSKNIPIAAGMAGGSSDAAATFRGMNELFELNLMDKELMEMATPLGADIPYCIMGGTALSEGIGEVLTRLPNLPECTFLVAKPPISVSTGEAYGGYDGVIAEYEKDPKSFRDFHHPDVDGQVDKIYAGNLKGVADRFGNVLEYVTAKNHPEIKELEQIMKDGGAINSVMSGSGPTVFAIFDSREKAERVKYEIEEKGLANQTFVTIPVF